MTGGLIFVISLLVILSYMSITAIAIAALILSLLLGEAFTPFLPSFMAYMTDGLPFWLLFIIISISYCFGFVVLTITLSPAILLLGIYDAIMQQTNMLKEQQTILLKRQSKMHQRPVKTEPSAF